MKKSKLLKVTKYCSESFCYPCCNCHRAHKFPSHNNKVGKGTKGNLFPPKCLHLVVSEKITWLEWYMPKTHLWLFLIFFFQNDMIIFKVVLWSHALFHIILKDKKRKHISHNVEYKFISQHLNGQLFTRRVL